MAKRRDTFNCPHCGAPVPQGALACRQCGSDAETGWGDSGDTGLAEGYEPDDDFDYDEFVAEEFPDHASPSPEAALRKFALRVVIALIVLSFVIAALLR
jgi:hypothetical protein